jgi:hypothetical protein
MGAMHYNDLAHGASQFASKGLSVGKLIDQNQDNGNWVKKNKG